MRDDGYGDEDEEDDLESGIVPWIDTRIDLGSEAEPIPNDLRENPISRSVGQLQAQAFGPVLAGCGRRLAAKFVDAGIVGTLFLFGTIYAIGRLSAAERIPWTIFVFTFGLFGGWFFWIFYHAILRGDTVGKRLLGLKVVDERARPIGLGRSVGRVLAETFSVVTLGIGYLFAVVDLHKRSLHDHLCGTRVVRRNSLPARPSLTGS